MRKVQNCQVAAERRLASPWGSELHTSVLHEGPGVDPGAAESSSLGTGTVLLTQQTRRRTGTRVCAQVLWLPSGSMASQVCLRSLYVLPLKVFIQVYVPENLWISSSAACGSMLRGEGKTVSRVGSSDRVNGGNVISGSRQWFWGLCNPHTSSPSKDST